MYTVILYKRPSTNVGFFQPDSPTWQDPALLAYYQKIKDDGILISDVIEISDDNLIMQKILTWKDFDTWQAYVENFVNKFPNYSVERHEYHLANNSSYSVNTFTDIVTLITTVGNLDTVVELSLVNGVVQASYTLN